MMTTYVQNTNAAHSDCCFPAPCTNILTYRVLTYLLTDAKTNKEKFKKPTNLMLFTVLWLWLNHCKSFAVYLMNIDQPCTKATDWYLLCAHIHSIGCILLMTAYFLCDDDHHAVRATVPYTHIHARTRSVDVIVSGTDRRGWLRGVLGVKTPAYLIKICTHIE